MLQKTEVRRTAEAIAIFLILAGTAACVTQPSRPIAPPPQPRTDVFVYPLQGQSADLQDRDRYECHGWAVQQTGFDPSAPYVPPHLRVAVSSGPPPSGAGIATGALAGAVIGSILSPPWDTGGGTLFGAIAGAAVGGLAESAAAQQAQDEATASAEYARAAALEEQARYYVRALTACLSGRGYEVR